MVGLEKQYRSSKDDSERVRLRNEFIGEMMSVTTEYHNAQMEHLRANKAFQGTFFDFAVLGLNAAGTVVGGAPMKAALAAAATGTQAAELSITKNFFQEQTMNAIQDQMDALREIEKKKIEKRLGENSTNYPLSFAKHDLLDLFYAGSVNRALRAISSDAAVKRSEQEQ